MPVTLRDIADKVGVSMMTVSRSLNGEAPSPDRHLTLDMRLARIYRCYR